MTISRGYLAPVIDGNATVEYVMRMSAQAFGVTIEQMKSMDRHHPLVVYRQVAMAAMREVAGASFPEIGRLFGGRHHTTVMDAAAKCRQNDRMRIALASLTYEIRRQWAIDNGLDLPPLPGQLSLVDGADVRASE